MKYTHSIKYACFLVVVISVFACKDFEEKKEALGLKNAATFPIGTAININRLLNDAKLQKLEIENFNSITATSDMKMQAILTAENKYNWKTVDTILHYAKNTQPKIIWA